MSSRSLLVAVVVSLVLAAALAVGVVAVLRPFGGGPSPWKAGGRERPADTVQDGAASGSGASSAPSDLARDGDDGTSLRAGGAATRTERPVDSSAPATSSPEDLADGDSAESAEGTDEATQDGASSARRSPPRLDARGLPIIRPGPGLAGLAVFVEDSAGDAVEGVTVRVFGDRVTDGERRTDSGGLAVFDSLKPGAHRIGLAAKGSSPLVGRNAILLEAGDVESVRLIHDARDAHVSGRVVDPAGEPVEGIAVSAIPLGREEGENPLVPESGYRSARSAADGFFEIRELARGEHVVTSEATEIWPSVRRVVSAPTGEADLVLEEEVEFELFGRTLDPDGLPVPNVRITVSAPAQPVTSGADGAYAIRFALRLSNSGQVVVVARHDDFLKSEQSLSRRQLSAEVEAGQFSREHDIVLEPLGEHGSLSGHLVDVEGNAVGGETVYLHSRQADVRYNDVASAEGRYVFEKVKPASDYRLWVYPKQGFQDVTFHPVTIEARDQTRDIVLEPLEVGALEGTLRDSAGRPVPQLTIFVRSQSSLASSITTTTDAQGGFAVEDVPAGDVWVETRAVPKLSAHGIQVAPGEVTRVTIDTGHGDLGVRGRVVDTSGRPVSGARVVITKSTQGEVSTRLYNEAQTGRDGRFDIGGFGPGQCAASISAPGHFAVHEPVQLNAATPPLEFELRPRS